MTFNDILAYIEPRHIFIGCATAITFVILMIIQYKHNLRDDGWIRLNSELVTLGALFRDRQSMVTDAVKLELDVTNKLSNIILWNSNHNPAMLRACSERISELNGKLNADMNRNDVMPMLVMGKLYSVRTGDIVDKYIDEVDEIYQSLLRNAQAIESSLNNISELTRKTKVAPEHKSLIRILFEECHANEFEPRDVILNNEMVRGLQPFDPYLSQPLPEWTLPAKPTPALEAPKPKPKKEVQAVPQCCTSESLVTPVTGIRFNNATGMGYAMNGNGEYLYMVSGGAMAVIPTDSQHWTEAKALFTR